jgi:hypothetical protein
MTAPEGRYSLTMALGRFRINPWEGQRWLSSVLPCESS